MRSGYDIRVWGHVHNIPIKFGEDWSTSKEVTTAIFNLSNNAFLIEQLRSIADSPNPHQI